MESSSVEVGPDVSGSADSSQGPGKANTIDSAVRLRPNWLPRRRIVISIAILAISAVCACLLFHFLVGTRSRTAFTRTPSGNGTSIPPSQGYDSRN